MSTFQARVDRPKLDGLQAGRAVAALLVVAFHINVFILPDRLYDGDRAGAVFNMGYAGVEFFFVLSGFIMYHIHAKDFGVSTRAWTFFKRRIQRIYPIYWFILIGLLGLYAVTGSGPDNKFEPLAILTSLLLIPTPDFPIMRVAWTLEHEMLFYILFLSLIVNKRIGFIVFAVWMIGSVLIPLMGIKFFPLNFLFADYNLLFLFGMIVAWGYRFLSVPARMPIFMIGLSIYLGTGFSEALFQVDWTHCWRTWAYGIGAAMITAALAREVLTVPKWLVFLGDASYSIYLAHLPAMGVFVVVLAEFGGPWSLSPQVSGLLMMILAVLSGCLIYLCVERPLMRYSGSKS
ncbi:MAG: acyltransferase [Pseudomonadota bacterium]